MIISLLFLAVSAQAKPTTDYPDVVPIFSKVSFEGTSDMAGRCSGTFIHPRLLLTAAHCVRFFNETKMNGHTFRASDAFGNLAPDITAKPSQVYVPRKKWWGTKEIHPAYVHVSPAAITIEHSDISLDHVEQDLAILEFSSDFPYTRELAERIPPEGSPVIMVGFGQHGRMEFGTAGVGATVPVKNEGRNTLQRRESDRLIVEGSVGTCEQPEKYFDDWAVCGGDSGGALIDAFTGRILGVTSGSVRFKDDDHDLPILKRKLSTYTDVTSPAAQEFIRSVLELVRSR